VDDLKGSGLAGEDVSHDDGPEILGKMPPGNGQGIAGRTSPSPMCMCSVIARHHSSHVGGSDMNWRTRTDSGPRRPTAAPGATVAEASRRGRKGDAAARE